MVIFESREQFLLIPAVGFVIGEDAFYLTIAVFFYGVSFRLFRWKC